MPDMKIAPSVAQSVADGENQKVQKETKINNVESKKDGAKKLALALGGLAVIGAATAGVIYAVKKHKMPENISIDEFKKVGKFEKGKAFIYGKAYTGVIEVPNKTGKTVIEYSEGALKSSTKLNKISGTNTPIDGTFSEEFKKVYSEKDGVKTIEFFSKVPTSGKFVQTGKTTITPDKITSTHPSLIAKSTEITEKQADGSIKRTITKNVMGGRDAYKTVTRDLNTGEIISEVQHPFNIPTDAKPVKPEQQQAFKL